MQLECALCGDATPCRLCLRFHVQRSGDRSWSIHLQIVNPLLTLIHWWR